MRLLAARAWCRIQCCWWRLTWKATRKPDTPLADAALAEAQRVLNRETWRDE